MRFQQKINAVTLDGSPVSAATAKPNRQYRGGCRGNYPRSTATIWDLLPFRPGNGRQAVAVSRHYTRLYGHCGRCHGGSRLQPGHCSSSGSYSQCPDISQSTPAACQKPAFVSRCYSWPQLLPVCFAGRNL